MTTLVALNRGLRVLCWCLWGLVLGGGLLIGRLVLGPAWQRPRLDAWQLRWFRRLATLMGVQLLLPEHLPAAGFPRSQGLLVVANHLSWLDVVVLGCYRPMRFLAREDVSFWPLLGWLAGLSGTLFIRRGDPLSAEAVQARLTRYLRGGQVVCFFPEATTRPPGQTGRFHRRLFRSARESGVAVLPVQISYAQESRPGVVSFIGHQSFIPHLWRILQEPRLLARVRVAEPIHPGVFENERGLAAAARRAVIELAPNDVMQP